MTTPESATGAKWLGRYTESAPRYQTARARARWYSSLHATGRADRRAAPLRLNWPSRAAATSLPSAAATRARWVHPTDVGIPIGGPIDNLSHASGTPTLSALARMRTGLTVETTLLLGRAERRRLGVGVHLVRLEPPVAPCGREVVGETGLPP